MIKISVSADVRRLTASLHDAARKQIPFAAASALNDLAFQVQRAEAGGLLSTFKHPRPFTAKSTLVDKARKSSLTARVYIRPEAAKYIAPYEFGGVHVLPGKGLLDPKNVRLDQYGQLRKGEVKQLLARPDVFGGTVMFKDGQTITGIWQRPRKKGALKLLIRIGDALDVTQHLDFRARAETLVRQQFQAAFVQALSKALATAK